MKTLRQLPLVIAGLTLLFFAGCGTTPAPENETENQTTPNQAAQNQATEVRPTPSKPPEDSAEIQKKIRFNLDKLKDRSYTKTYSEGYIWYTAAEELGEIGKPAIPHLIKKLDSKDPYELKLALYALQLASQDSRVTALTNGEYVNLVSALDEKDNAKNKAIALHWWSKYKNWLQPVV